MTADSGQQTKDRDWAEFVERMRGEGLSFIGRDVVRIIYNRTGDRRVLFLRSRRGFFIRQTEQLCVFDEDESLRLPGDTGQLYGYWNPTWSGSLFGTLADALRDFRASPESAWFDIRPEDSADGTERGEKMIER